MKSQVTIGSTNARGLAPSSMIENTKRQSYRSTDLSRTSKGNRIRLRGRLNGRVEDIDPIDATKGEIDIFDNTLEIDKQIYTDVHCITLQTTSRPRQKFDRARNAAQAIWGSDGPPSHLSNSLICRDVADRLRKDGQRADINDATILRAVGRKK